MDETLPTDSALDAELERQIAPYRALLPAEALEAFRDVLRDALTEDAVLSSLMRQLRPVKAVARSGDRAIDDTSEDINEKKPAAR